MSDYLALVEYRHVLLQRLLPSLAGYKTLRMDPRKCVVVDAHRAARGGVPKACGDQL